MNAILSSSEIKTDLTSAALRALWHSGGECSPHDLIAAGHCESTVAKYGSEAIAAAFDLYRKARAS